METLNVQTDSLLTKTLSVRVLGASCEVAGLNTDGNIEQMQNGFRCKRYKSRAENLLIADWATRICEDLLKEIGISVDEIGLIVSICLSPDRIGEEKTVAGPRLCHPLQRGLKAKNAFAIDLLDCEWPIAIQVATNLMYSQQYKYALIVRGDLLNYSVKPDRDNGFDIPDGIGALLIQSGESIPSITRYEIAHKEQNAQVRCLSEINDIYDFKGLLKWPFSKSFMQRIQLACIDSLITEGIEKTTFIIEKWFPEHLDLLQNSRIDPTGNLKDQIEEPIGPFTLPWQLQHLIKTGKSLNEPQKLTLLSFNPFCMRYASITLNI